MSPKLSRRAFVVSAFGLAIAAAGGGVLLWRRRRRAAVPAVEPGPTGEIDDATYAVLLATPGALVDGDVELEHYRDFFRFRAARVPGYLDLYRAFAQSVAEATRRLGVGELASAPPATRREVIVEGCFSRALGAGRLAGGPDDETRARFELYVAREILELFNATDAWILLGYDAWPGTARGLDAYRKPVR
jgi:hypothetical protein